MQVRRLLLGLCVVLLAVIALEAKPSGEVEDDIDARAGDAVEEEEEICNVNDDDDDDEDDGDDDDEEARRSKKGGFQINIGQGGNKKQSTWSKLKEKGKEAWDNTKEKGKEAWTKGKEKGKEAWAKGKEKGKEAWAKGKEKGKEAWAKGKEKGKEAWAKGKQKGKEAWDKTKEKGKEAWGKAKEKGKQAAKKIGKGIAKGTVKSGRVLMNTTKKVGKQLAKQGKKLGEQFLDELVEKGVETAVVLIQPVFKEFIHDTATKEFCECTSSKKCVCCAQIPGLKKGCMEAIACPSSHQMAVVLYYGQESVTGTFITDENETAEQCQTLPGSLKGLEVCIISRGINIVNGDPQGCWKITINALNLHFVKCLTYTDDGAVLTNE